ncbi:MAG: hypothetical protein HBSAPP02_29690 [Phycisphaerae bacterium]|nr:MAG: DUF1573 domain-containing protein [Planctomycetia bacterium]RIK69485.1 MAG: hypothetical protein DCC66_08980 [Planctomycetota bacterium]GJQ27937.1 MAG: hypothetical protein HBSAPP02_29690 [Phycisphaerae bacterium]
MNKAAWISVRAALVLSLVVNFGFGQPPTNVEPGQKKQQDGGAAEAKEAAKRISVHGGAPKQKIAPQPSEPTVVLKPGEVPAIKFDTPTFNFGRVRAGTDVTHDFWFTNTGTGPLELLSVRPSCGCTTSGQYDRVVQPGQSGKIPIKLSTGHGAGPMTKSISVQTNVPGEGATVTLQVTGTLWQVVQAVPTNVNYSSLRASGLTEEQLTKKVIITNNDQAPMKPSEPKVSGGPFKASLKTLTEGKEYELTVVAQQPLSKGSNTASIQIATGNAEIPMLNIPVSLYVMSDVEISPAQLQIPPTATILKPLDRMFFVRNYTDKPIQVKEVTTTNPAIKTQLTELQAGTAWRLTVTLPEQYTAAAGERMVLKTDSPTVPELIVPFMQSSPTIATGTPAKQAPRPAGVGVTNMSENPRE